MKKAVRRSGAAGGPCPSQAVQPRTAMFLSSEHLIAQHAWAIWPVSICCDLCRHCPVLGSFPFQLNWGISGLICCSVRAFLSKKYKKTKILLYIYITKSITSSFLQGICFLNFRKNFKKVKKIIPQQLPYNYLFPMK
jgi:hypothetical protein